MGGYPTSQIWKLRPRGPHAPAPLYTVIMIQDQGASPGTFLFSSDYICISQDSVTEETEPHVELARGVGGPQAWLDPGISVVWNRSFFTLLSSAAVSLSNRIYQ